MKLKKISGILFVAFLFIASFSCKKIDCFDEDLFEKSRGILCTEDCPGVIGCDGKTYCNECEANRSGIRIQ